MQFLAFSRAILVSGIWVRKVFNVYPIDFIRIRGLTSLQSEFLNTMYCRLKPWL
jgi:hypothetical protein